MSWEIVVGIETHTQLLTKSKMFSGAANAFGAAPNTQAGLVDIALPGTLPVANRAAVEHAIRFGLAVNGKISPRSIFARKNYFYPDLPKAYQISQYEIPVVQGGSVKFFVDKEEKTVRLTRAHLEEDAGKSLHEAFQGMTGIDLNRAGTPLLEIVTEPELRGAKEAVAYAKALHTLVVSLGICDGNMQEGSFRCDANVSVRKVGEQKLGTRCEIKNLNSFRFMEQAIEFEAKRQIQILEDGGKIEQQTHLFDPERNETRPMRSKEDAQDYRYFPDPDLLPLIISPADIEHVRASMPETLESKRYRFVQAGIPAHVAETLTASLSGKTRVVDKGQSIVATLAIPPQKKAEILRNMANSVVSSSSPMLDSWGETSVQNFDLPRELIQIQVRASEGRISSRQAKEVEDEVLAGKGTTDEIISKKGLTQISDSDEIERVVDEVLKANVKQVEDYRAGKGKAFNSLVGQVMKATKGKANPAQVNEILRRKLSA